MFLPCFDIPGRVSVGAHNLSVAADHPAKGQAKFPGQYQDNLNLGALAERDVGDDKNPTEAYVPRGGSEGVPTRSDVTTG